MARKQLGACIFCAPNPCTCEVAKPKKASRGRTGRPSSASDTPGAAGIDSTDSDTQGGSSPSVSSLTKTATLSGTTTESSLTPPMESSPFRPLQRQGLSSLARKSTKPRAGTSTQRVSVTESSTESGVATTQSTTDTSSGHPSESSSSLKDNSSMKVEGQSGILFDDSDRRPSLSPSRSKDQREADEQEFRQALTVLCESGLIHWAEVEKHRKELLLPEPEGRALAWRTRQQQTARSKKN